MIHLTGNFYGVAVPDGIINPTIIQSHSYFNSPRLEHGTGGIDLPIGDYKLLFLRSQATEEQAALIVDSWDSVANDGTKIYENYLTEIPKSRTAIKSLESLFQSLNLHGEVAVLEKIS